MALTLPDLGLKKKLNPLGQVMDTAGLDARKASKTLPTGGGMLPPTPTSQPLPKTPIAPTGGGMMPPTPSSQPLPSTPSTSVSSMAGRKNVPQQDTSMIPVVNAGESIDPMISQAAISDINAGMPIEEFDNIYPELATSKGLFEQYALDIKAGMPPEEGVKMYPELFGQAPTPTATNTPPVVATPENAGETIGQSALGVVKGIGTKTAESFMGGMRNIGAAGEDFASGKIGMASAAVRGGMGAVQSALSPISGILGQGLEEGFNALPETTQTSIKETAMPIIQKAVQAYEAEPPEQQERLKDIMVATDLLTTLLGAQAVTQTGKNLLKEGTKQTVKKLPEAVPVETTGIVPKIKEFGQQLKRGIEGGNQSISFDVEKGTVSKIGKLTPKATEVVIKQPKVVSEVKKALTPLVRVKEGRIVRSPEKIDQQLDAIVGDMQRRGDVPTDLNSGRDSMERGMKEVYTKHLSPALEASNVKFNASEVADKIEDGISEFAKDLAPGEYTKAQEFIKTLRSPEYQNMDLMKAEKFKQFMNAITDYAAQGQEKIFNNLLKDAGSATNDMIDAGLGTIDGQGIKQWKNLYGSYSDSLYDINKAIIKFDRKAPEGLFSGLGKLSGLGDIASGALKLEPKEVATGLAKMAGGKYLQSRNDPNQIIKRAFEKAGTIKSFSLEDRAPKIPKPPVAQEKPPVLALPPPSGKGVSAKVVDVQPIKAPAKVNPTDITAKSKIVRPGTVAKLEDKQALVKQQQALINKDKTIQSIATEAKQLLDNVKGRGIPDVVDRMVLKMEGALGENKMSITDIEKAVIKADPKKAYDIMDRIYAKIDEKGYSIGNDGVIQKVTPLVKKNDKGITYNDIASYKESLGGESLKGKTNAWSKDRYDRLQGLLSKEEQKKPIIISKGKNGKYDIVDGNHRFEVLKELGLPIKFQEEGGGKTGLILNPKNIVKTKKFTY